LATSANLIMIVVLFFDICPQMARRPILFFLSFCASIDSTTYPFLLVPDEFFSSPALVEPPSPVLLFLPLAFSGTRADRSYEVLSNLNKKRVPLFLDFGSTFATEGASLFFFLESFIT